MSQIRRPAFDLARLARRHTYPSPMYPVEPGLVVADVALGQDVALPAGSVMLGALLALVASLYANKQNRRAMTQLQALVELQERCLALRGVYRQWGRELEHSDQSELALDEALERTQVAMRRVRCDVVRARCGNWTDVSGISWDGDDAVTVGAEERLWLALLDAIEVDLRRFD